MIANINWHIANTSCGIVRPAGCHPRPTAAVPVLGDPRATAATALTADENPSVPVLRRVANKLATSLPEGSE